MPTLIELMISLAITSMLATLGISSWNHIKLLQQTTYITHSLQQSFYFAREQAVLSNQNVLIIPNDGHWQNGWKIQQENSRKILFQIKNMPSNIKYTAFQQNSGMIKVFPDSTTMGYQGHFDYNNQHLILNQGGRLRLESFNPA